MGRMLVRVDAAVRQAEGAGWIVLVIAALLVPWSGWERPLSGEQGAGLVWLDAIVTAMLWAAFSAQVTRILSAPPREHITVRVAAWLLLLTLGLLCGRLAWLLATTGDVRMTVSMALALICLSVSVLLHSVGRVVYGER